MHKTSTHTYLKHLSTGLAALVIVLCSSFTSADVSNSPYDKNIQARTIRCYPNPAVSYINFDIPDNYLSKNYTLEVYSFTGKKMYEVGVNSAKATLTFSNQFYRGIYVYQLQDKAGKTIETGKFQVNR